MRSTILLLVVVELIFSSCKNDETFIPQKVADIDGNVYKTVTIGTQVWMAENLKVSRSSDGNEISNSVPNNDTSYVNTYGRLYDWESAIKVCPRGWHLPSSNEWFILLSHLDESITLSDSSGYLGEQTGGVLKSVLLWEPPNDGATNSSGFSALPSGFFENGDLLEVRLTTNFWSSTEGNNSQAFGGINVNYNSSSVFRGYMNKTSGHCVRCLKD